MHMFLSKKRESNIKFKMFFTFLVMNNFTSLYLRREALQKLLKSFEITHFLNQFTSINLLTIISYFSWKINKTHHWPVIVKQFFPEKKKTRIKKDIKFRLFSVTLSVVSRLYSRPCKAPRFLFSFGFFFT